MPGYRQYIKDQASMKIKKIFLYCSLTSLFIQTNIFSLKEGTLTLKNSLPNHIRVKYETLVTDGTIRNIFTIAKNIAFNCISSASENPEHWDALDPNESKSFNTPWKIDPKLGGSGSIWGDIIKLHVYNIMTRKAELFLLPKPTNYTVSTLGNELVIRDNLAIIRSEKITP